MHRIALVAALLLSAAPVPAAAQVETMRAAMHEYFDGEVAGSWVFLGEGLVATAAGAGLLLLYEGEGEDFWRGAAIPLLAIGVVQAATGIAILARTPGQVEDLDAQLTAEPAAYRAAELERMERINFQFDLLAVVEIGLFVGAAGMLAYGLLADDERFTGAGAGLAAQTLVTFLLDLWAASRADTYTAALRNFSP